MLPLRRFALICLATLIGPVARADDPVSPKLAAKATAEPIRYTIRFPAPESHYAEVLAAIPTAGAADVAEEPDPQA